MGPDHEAVTRAVLDYVDAVEDGNPEQMEGAISLELHKFGFHRASAGGTYNKIPMTHDQLINLAATFLDSGYVPESPQHSVEVFEVLDKTASAKLTAFWGIDYMHLVKNEGRWEIVQVLWQSAPED